MSIRGIKRKALSLEEKLKILDKVEENSHLTRIQIAKMLELPVTTLNGIVAKRDVIRNCSVYSSKTKKLKRGKYEDLEDKLILWFKKARSANIPINGSILREMAEEIAEKMDIEFIASNGWIDRMKKRIGLIYKSINGESASCDMQEPDEWKVNILPSLISGYKERDIFNMAECGLFYSLLPEKTFSVEGENCNESKSSKEYLTVLIGSNMDGSEKLRLMVVGKSKRPRCFKHVKSIPCEYVSNNAAWMTMPIYESYLKQLDLKMRKEKRKIVVFVENCAALSRDLKLENIKICFLPPSSTSVLQPMDQGVIRAFKQYYRKRLVKWMLQKLETTQKVDKVNVLESIYFIASAWESVSSDVIANCFKKAGFLKGELTVVNQPEVNKDEWRILQKKLNFTTSFDDYVDVDSNITPCEILSIEDICELMPEESENESSDTEDDSKIPSYTEAVQGLETFRRYVESQENVPEKIFFNLQQLDCFHLEMAEKKRKNRRKS